MHFRRVEGDSMKALLTSLLLAAVTLAGITASAAECYLPWNARSDLRMQWLQADCRYSFPQRDGFAWLLHPAPGGLPCRGLQDG